MANPLENTSEMQKRRLFFAFLFAIGTILAMIGWTAELKSWPGQLSDLALIGHAVQVIGMFGNLITPDKTVTEPLEVINEEEEYV